MKYKLVKVIEKNGKESYTIKKRNFLGIWKTENLPYPTDCELITFKMDRLTLKEANEMIKYLINISNKSHKETIKEFEI